MPLWMIASDTHEACASALIRPGGRGQEFWSNLQWLEIMASVLIISDFESSRIAQYRISIKEDCLCLMSVCLSICQKWIRSEFVKIAIVAETIYNFRS